MKFVVERDALVDAVNWVSKSISNRPITTALLGIVIDATDEITLSGSDLETSAKAKFKAEISQKGKVLVPGKLLAEISRSLPAKPVINNHIHSYPHLIPSLGVEGMENFSIFSWDKTLLLSLLLDPVG